MRRQLVAWDSTHGRSACFLRRLTVVGRPPRQIPELAKVRSDMQRWFRSMRLVRRGPDVGIQARRPPPLSPEPGRQAPDALPGSVVAGAGGQLRRTPIGGRTAGSETLSGASVGANTLHRMISDLRQKLHDIRKSANAYLPQCANCRRRRLGVALAGLVSARHAGWANSRPNQCSQGYGHCTPTVARFHRAARLCFVG